jgi:pyruvate ferredoxin oxidoreductase delta subunit
MNAGKTKATVTWQKMTHGSHIFDAGNAVQFQTGDWRSDTPKFLADKCKQCLLCFPVCPDSAINLNKDGEVTGIDFDFCKGCLVCVKACPFKAIIKEEVAK